MPQFCLVLPGRRSLHVDVSLTEISITALSSLSLLTYLELEGEIAAQSPAAEVFDVLRHLPLLKVTLSPPSPLSPLSALSLL